MHRDTIRGGRICVALTVAVTGLLSCPTNGIALVAQLPLAAAGKTGYVIVTPEQPTAVDDYAVTALTNFLFQKTGAVFPIIPPGHVAPTNNRIFVGLSKPALQRTGQDPLASLKDQEYVARSIGGDIVLYGQGLHGNLHAVLDFMEHTLGRRWYSAPLVHGDPQIRASEAGEPVFAVERDLNIAPFARQRGFAFKYRMSVMTFLFDYNLQSGLNMFEDKPAFLDAGAFSLKTMPTVGHTLFGYIPPSPRHLPSTNVFGWAAHRNYFETNPEFFTMNAAGDRVVDQLCFSNPDLRVELTRNVLEHIRVLKAAGKERILLNLSAMDNSGEFCFCPGCRALKEEYLSPGGPIFDYLFELCPIVKERHPDVTLHTFAYRLSQTQKPPVMPAGQSFPDNLVVQFANVQANTDADWTSPANRPSYADLLAWRALTPHLWIWYYASTYADNSRMPNAAVSRLVADVRLMKAADVEGVMVEFAMDVLAGHNFTQLQRFILMELQRDSDADVPALIREFTDYQYGPAAPLTRGYLDELEAAREEASQDTSLSAGRSLERVMTSLTPGKIWRWQESFDRMEAAAAAEERCLKNVRRLRHTLDYATLKHWTRLAREFADYFTDHRVIRDRLGALPPWDTAAVEDWEMMIKIGDVAKPPPAPFDALDPALVRRFVPVRGSGVPKIVIDPDAAFGYGAVVDAPNLPFTFSFYENDTRRQGASCLLNPDEIPRGVYRLYPLGEIQVTPDCIVWFSGWSCVTQLQLGERLYRPPGPDNDNRYDVHVSLKFDPLIEGYRTAYHTAPPITKDFSVICDQIIFVKKPVQ